MQFSLACTLFFSQNRAHDILKVIFHLSYIIYAYMWWKHRWKLRWKLNNLTSVIHYSLGVFLPIIHYSDMTVLFIIPDSPSPNIHYSFSVYFF